MRYEYFIQNKWLFLQLDPYKCLSMFILGWNHSVKFDKIQANINTQITLHTSAKLIITLVFDADMPTFPSGAYFYICFLFNVCAVSYFYSWLWQSAIGLPWRCATINKSLSPKRTCITQLTLVFRILNSFTLSSYSKYFWLWWMMN